MAPMLHAAPDHGRSHRQIYTAQLMHRFPCSRAKTHPVPYSRRMVQKRLFAGGSQGKDPKSGTFSEL